MDLVSSAGFVRFGIGFVTGKEVWVDLSSRFSGLVIGLSLLVIVTGGGRFLLSSVGDAPFFESLRVCC